MPPIFEIDWNKHPQLADNIWHAQKAGHPNILTRCDLAIKIANRSVVMDYEVGSQQYRVPTTSPLDRDEYPFACTLEGGGGAWIGHVHYSQNRAMGSPLWQFFKANGIEPYPSPNSKFKVRILNHPLG
jgi:hypothetical protein